MTAAATDEESRVEAATRDDSWVTEGACEDVGDCVSDDEGDGEEPRVTAAAAASDESRMTFVGDEQRREDDSCWRQELMKLIRNSRLQRLSPMKNEKYQAKRRSRRSRRRNRSNIGMIKIFFFFSLRIYKFFFLSFYFLSCVSCFLDNAHVSSLILRLSICFVICGCLCV